MGEKLDVTPVRKHAGVQVYLCNEPGLTPRFGIRHDEDGTYTLADSWNKIVEKIERGQKVKSVKLAIRCILHDPRKEAAYFVRATITGIHGGSGNLIVKPDSGIAEQIASYNTDRLLMDLSDESLTELRDAAKVSRDTRKQYDKLLDRARLKDAYRLAADAKAQVGD